MSEQVCETKTQTAFQGRIGVATVDITPPVGIYARNWGAARHDVAESLHRRLTLNALVLYATESEKPLIFIDADLGWWRSLITFNRFQSRMLQEIEL